LKHRVILSATFLKILLQTDDELQELGEELEFSNQFKSKNEEIQISNIFSSQVMMKVY